MDAKRQKITKVASPTARRDAATKGYVSNSEGTITSLAKREGNVSMTGDLNMAIHNIIHVQFPTLASDAAQTYDVDSSIRDYYPIVP